LYLSGTAVTGSVPESWKTFSSLQQLTMDTTQLQCALVVDAQNQVSVRHCHVSPLRLTSATPLLILLDLLGFALCVLLLLLAQLTCPLPSWLTPSLTATDIGSAASPTAPSLFHCPALLISGSAGSSVTLDETYYARTLCTCDADSFGINGICVRCPSGCTCSKDVIQVSG
jgi:hypothetical protein